jgi:hypothetical protein
MAIDAVAFEEKVKELYTANIVGLSGHNPFAQKNTSYLREFIHSIANTLAVDCLQITAITTDTGLGGFPIIPGAGPAGKMSVVNEPLLGHIYRKVREAVIREFGRTAHEEWPPTQGSGLYLKAIIDCFTQTTTEFYNKQLIITSIHPLVYLGAYKITAGGFKAPQPNIMVSDIMGKAPSLKGRFWPIFVKAFVDGYVEYVQTELTGAGTIVGICVPSLAQVCGTPMVGAGTGTII